MTDDIRINSDFPTHFKTKKLISIAGYEGVFALILLWCYCRSYRPKGDLSGISDRDIDIICGFNAERIENEYESFAACLHHVGFLDKTPTGYQLHDWAEHNPYAFFAEERSQSARDSANKRWQQKKTDKSQSNAKRIPNVCETETKGNAPYPYLKGYICKSEQISRSKQLEDGIANEHRRDALEESKRVEASWD